VAQARGRKLRDIKFDDSKKGWCWLIYIIFLFHQKAAIKSTSAKVTIDPEGTRLLGVLYAYTKHHKHSDGQRRLIHCKITTKNLKLYWRNFYVFFCTIQSTIIRVIFWKTSYLMCKVVDVYTVEINGKFCSMFIEGSMSSLKSKIWNKLWSQKWLHYDSGKSELVDLWRIRARMCVQSFVVLRCILESLRDFFENW